MNSNAIIEVKRDAYIQAAHDEYMRLTKKTYDELKNYAKSEWGGGSWHGRREALPESVTELL